MERHYYFFGNYPKDPELYLSNQKAIRAQVAGNYRVRCGHCGVVIHGAIKDDGPVTEIVWEHDGESTWFGEFTIFPP